MLVEVKKPFTYYINGCYKQNFQAGIKYDLPEDCVRYAKNEGFLDDTRAGNTKRSKSPVQD